MVSPAELSLSQPEVLTNLGDRSLEEQRDAYHLSLIARGLIDPEDAAFLSSQPLADIIKMRRVDLEDYVKNVLPLMRNGAVDRIRVDGDHISPDEIFDTLETKDGVERESLLTRVINRDRVGHSIQTGSDRDGSSNTGYHGGKYEDQAMKEYAIPFPGDITYATRTDRTSRPIAVNQHSAVLVYASQALQEIIPRHAGYIQGSSGLHAFIDSRLKAASLLAVVESSTPPSQAKLELGNVAVAYGTSWSLK